MASIKTPLARLMTSDSVVDQLVGVCFVLDHVNGKQVLRPVNGRKFPDVDMASSLSPAKSASAYSDNSKSSAGSPIFPLSP